MTDRESYYITESPWLMSKQIGWEAQITNPRLPHWLRIYAVAMARSEPNLHTPLETGELAKLLGKPQPDGSIKPLDRRDLNAYLNKAVERDLLDQSSSVRCLVLPASVVECRRLGYKKPCAHHTGQASKIKRPIAIKQRSQTPMYRTNSNDASPQVQTSGVGQLARQRRVENTPTPGSRDIFTVKSLSRERSSV